MTCSSRMWACAVGCCLLVQLHGAPVSAATRSVPSRPFDSEGSLSSTKAVSQRALDIVVVVDNSGSMGPKISSLEDELYDHLVALQIADGVDTRVIVVSKHGDNASESICFEVPLSSVPVGGCSKCHDVHDPTVTPVPDYLLPVDNTNSAYCIACHDGAQAPGIGANTHYTGVPTDVNMNSGLTPPLPWANQIDEDGTAGADFTGATANMMVCESCHSVHRNGNAGVDGQYFLRHENGNANQLCSACHTAN